MSDGTQFCPLLLIYSCCLYLCCWGLTVLNHKNEFTCLNVERQQKLTYLIACSPELIAREPQPTTRLTLSWLLLSGLSSGQFLFRSRRARSHLRFVVCESLRLKFTRAPRIRSAGSKSIWLTIDIYTIIEAATQLHQRRKRRSRRKSILISDRFCEGVIISSVAVRFEYHSNLLLSS